MPERVSISINGVHTEIPCGTSVAVAIILAGQACRISTSGQPRTALCGMGICFECRATVNGIPQRRTCQIACEPGMRVETQQ